MKLVTIRGSGYGMRVRDRKLVPAFLTLFAYATYVCAPIFHISSEPEHFNRTEFDSHNDSLVTQGCPDPCDDPSHDHKVHDPDRCPHCQLIATSTAITHGATISCAGDDVCVYRVHSNYQIIHVNWIDHTDPIRGPPQT